MPRVILDENVSLQVAAPLEALGYEITNPVRFPPTDTSGILHITHGNLRGRDEADLVERFLRNHRLEDFSGRPAVLSPAGFRIR